MALILALTLALTRALTLTQGRGAARAAQARHRLAPHRGCAHRRARLHRQARHGGLHCGLGHPDLRLGGQAACRVLDPHRRWRQARATQQRRERKAQLRGGMATETREAHTRERQGGWDGREAGR